MRRSRLARGLGPTAAIVGPGRLGQALGRLLREAGVALRWVVARRREAARRAVRFIGGGRAVELGEPEAAEASVILLTVSDSAIVPVARRLARLRTNWRGKVVLHTCGSLPASALEPLKRLGASVGSLHPFQTVPSAKAGVRNLKGCFWAVEGDSVARGVAYRWVKALGGVAFHVNPTRKTFYHLAAFLVCPTNVTLMEASIRLLKQAGVPDRIARPMLWKFVTETARNFAELGARRALTGPAARGDWDTIGRHLAALRTFAPSLLPVYKSLVRAMVRLAGRHVPHSLRKALES